MRKAYLRNLDMPGKDAYRSPAVTAVEVTAEGAVCGTSTLGLVLGLEGGVSPANDGVQDYHVEEAQNW